MAETSDRVSSIAARYRTITEDRLIALVGNDASLAQLTKDIRSMSASLARQDETKGLRKLFNRIVGRTA